MSCRPNSTLLRQKREGLQQEAAQVTAELAGLEERRRGAEAAFQRIDRLHADLERRVQSIEQQRTAATAEREQRIAESAVLAERQKELAAVAHRSAGPYPDHRRPGAGRCASSWRRWRPQLKTGRAALDQLREDRAGRSSELAKLRSDLEYLEASCLAEVNVEAEVLRADAQIARLARRRTRRRGRNLPHPAPAHRADGPGQHDGPRRVQGNRRAPRLPRNPAQGSDRVHRKHPGDHQGDRSDLAHQVRRGLCQNQRELRPRSSRGSSRAARPSCASPTQENQAESGLEIVASPPGKKLQNVLLLSGGEKSLTALALLVGIFQFQPSPFCVLDEVDAALDETNVGRLADLLHSLSRETQFLLVTHSKRMMQAADMIYGVTMQEPGVSKVVSVRLGQSRTAARHGVASPPRVCIIAGR